MTHQEDRTISLTQPQLIVLVLQDFHLTQPNMTPQKTTALLSILLHKDIEGVPVHLDFHYQSVIGKLNFLEESIYSLCSASMCLHADTVKKTSQYLKESQHLGITLNPDHAKSFQCWVDADFAGNWKPEGASADPMMSK